MSVTFLTNEDEKKYVKSFNGVKPDPETGDVKIAIPEGNVGDDGGYYTPAVNQIDDTTVEFTFSPSKEDMPSINPVQVTLPISENSGGNVELDTTLTQSGKAADAKAVGDKIAEITGISLVEPAYEDIPKIFFGGALQQTKDEAVVPFRYISKTDDFSGYAEIKAQGNSSMSYPKKNQTVKMFADEACDSKMKKDFKGWGKQNKHVYKANWIDLTHARNIVSARLWADVVKSRANYAELPELLRTSPNQGAVDGFPVKVYADGVYQGRYTLNIPKDKWAFNMDDELDTHCVLCGENYVSGCFRAAANINGSDWSDEIHDVVPASIKTRWNEVISFVMNSTDEDFKANLGNYFDIPSLLDYHLFGIMSCGLDAYGKNQIYMTYDGQTWIASMYDMDSTWGLWWTGQSFVATDYDRSEYQDMKDGAGNLLYIRLEKLFYEELKARWAELRSGALSIENIINRFERFTDIAPAELVKEDYASTTADGKFTGIPSKTANTIQQIRGYAVARHAWCDTYVSALTGGGEVDPDEPDVPDVPETIPCTGITLSASELTFTENGSQTIVATVEPTDTTDSVVWSVSPSGIATVIGGVVSPVANGSCIVTATCGEQFATCSVSVNMEQVNILKAVIWEDGFFNGNTGIDIAGAELRRTNYFDVSAYAGKTVVLASNGYAVRVAAYDEGGNCVGAGYTDNDVLIFDIPETAKTARIAVKNAAGATVELYTNALVDADTEFNTIYGSSDGIKSENGIHSTKRITVQPNTSVVGSKITSGVIWDSNMEYVAPIANTGDCLRFDLPENAGFVNANYVNTNENSVFLSSPNTQIGYSVAVE